MRLTRRRAVPVLFVAAAAAAALNFAALTRRRPATTAPPRRSADPTAAATLDDTAARWRPRERAGTRLTAAGAVSVLLRSGRLREPELPPLPDDLQLNETLAAWRYPQSCPGRGWHPKPKALMYPHAGSKRVESWGLAVKTVLTPAVDMPAAVAKKARGGGGGVYAADGTAVPETVSAAPTDAVMHGECRRGEFSNSVEAMTAARRALDPEAEGCRRRLVWAANPADADRWPQAQPPQPPLWVAAVHNAWIHGGNVFTCSWALHGGGCLQEFTQFKPPSVRCRQAVALGDAWAGGYFHFVHEQLPRVAVVLSALRDNTTLLTVPRSRFVAEYLVGILGLDPGQLVQQSWAGGAASGGDVAAARALMPVPQPCGAAMTAAVLLLRRHVLGRLGLPHAVAAADGRRSLLVAERRGRTASNWDECVQGLRGIDAVEVTVLRPGGTPVARQIELFNAADAVIGPHGANLANVLWMRHGTSMVEVVSRREGNLCYYVAATRVGVHHSFLLHDGGKDAGNYTVDPAAAAKAVRGALAAARFRPHPL